MISLKLWKCPTKLLIIFIYLSLCYDDENQTNILQQLNKKFFFLFLGGMYFCIHLFLHLIKIPQSIEFWEVFYYFLAFPNKPGRNA